MIFVPLEAFVFMNFPLPSSYHHWARRVSHLNGNVVLDVLMMTAVAAKERQ